MHYQSNISNRNFLNFYFHLTFYERLDKYVGNFELFSYTVLILYWIIIKSEGTITVVISVIYSLRYTSYNNESNNTLIINLPTTQSLFPNITNIHIGITLQPALCNIISKYQL